MGGSIHLAIPLDPVVPKIRIRYQDVKLIENQRIVVRIDNWPISSQYPNGHFVRSLGPIHQLDTEISAILVEHSISVSQASQGFSQMSLSEMPIDTPENPWKPEEVDLPPPPFFLQKKTEFLIKKTPFLSCRMKLKREEILEI